MLAIFPICQSVDDSCCCEIDGVLAGGSDERVDFFFGGSVVEIIVEVDSRSCRDDVCLRVEVLYGHPGVVSRQYVLFVEIRRGTDFPKFGDFAAGILFIHSDDRIGVRSEESESNAERGESIEIQIWEITHQERVCTKPLVEFVLDEPQPSRYQSIALYRRIPGS